MQSILLKFLYFLVLAAVIYAQTDHYIDQHDRSRQYDNNNSNYNQQRGPAYDVYNGNINNHRNSNDPYNHDPYSNTQRDQYGNPRDPYNRDRDQFGRDRDQYGNPKDPYRDPKDPYRDPKDPYRDPKDPYRDPKDPYRDPKDPYNRDRDQYNRDRDHLGHNRDFDQNRSHYGQNRDQYGQNRDPYGPNRDQYGQNRDPYGQRDQYGNRDRDPYGSNRDAYNRDQFNRDNDQYGNPRDPYKRPNQYNQTYNRYNNQDPYNRNYNRNNQYGQPYDDNRNNFDDERDRYGPSNERDNCCEEYCYSEDVEPYIHFATKTAYDAVDKVRRNGQQHNVPGCTPIQYWSLNRHGTRLPGFNKIRELRNLIRLHAEIVRNYDQKRSYPDRGKLCPQDYDLFKRWRWNETVNEQNANALTGEGIEELKLLARRYKSKFGEIFNEPYTELAYYFQYVDTDRTHDSYQAYIEGLFGPDAFKVHANTFIDDKLIKPYETCRAWVNNVDENPNTFYEYRRFTEKPEYIKMVRDIFRRLGFRYTLNASIINDMYDLCRFEKAWNVNQRSPWCVVFNKEQLKMLEYAEDLKYFYNTGYGTEMNRRLGCPAVKDLYERFERTVNGDRDGNKATMYFTHSATLLTVLTAMGIAQDPMPLTADNFYQQQRRQWKTSMIDPFAANLVAVLYECSGSSDRHKVMFFLNEVPVEYPECSVGLCSWQTFQEKLQYVAENCNLNFCDGNSASTLKMSLAGLSLALTMVFFNFL